MTLTLTASAGAIRLSPIEVLACWEALDLGDPPFLLRLRRPGGTEAAQLESRRRLAAALAGLAGRGLSDGVSPAPALAGPLRLLAGADYLLDIRFTGPAGRAILGLGAIAGARGAAVVSNDGLGPMDLVPVDGARVASTLIGLLGSVEPGTGLPVNLPAAVFDEACAAARDGNLWTLADELQVRGVPRREATSLARMCGGVDFGGQLGVTTRFDGPERRGPWVVGFVRGGGRYFLQLRRDDTVTVCPTDSNRLVSHWRELLEHC